MASKAIQIAKKRKRQEQKADDTVTPPPVFALDKFLFKEQLDFVLDPSPFKTAVCSRRSGKTTACAAHLIHTAINNPDIVCLYVTLSRALAKKIIWKELRKINEDYELNATENKSELSMTFPNGSVIYLSGAGTLDQVANFRGMPLKVVYVDEAQSFRSHLEELVNDVFGPALMDYAGTMMLIGTPSPIPRGFFHDCAVSNPEWSHHHWTFWQNPFLPLKSGKTHQEILDRELKRRGLTIEDPSIKREWYGLWEKDLNALLLHYDKTINDFDVLPPGQYNYILGLDFGFVDADSFSVLAWSENSPITYLVEEVVTHRQTTDQMYKQFEDLAKRYPFSRIVGDPGGGGKKLVETINARYSMQLGIADKLGKIANYRILDDALRSGRFKARSTTKFAEDCDLLQKDDKKSTPDKTMVNGHSDAVDSVLYAFKESPAFMYTPPDNKPQEGTAEYMRLQAEEIWRTQAKMNKAASQSSSENISWSTDKNGIPSWLKFDE